MTELQFGLLGLGAVAVFGVAVYNTWQEYKHRKLAQQVLETQHTDVLLDQAESIEPPLSQSFNDTEPHFISESGFVSEPELEPLEDESPVISLATEPLEPSAKTERVEHHERIEPVMCFEDIPCALLEPDPEFGPEPEMLPAPPPDVDVPTESDKAQRLNPLGTKEPLPAVLRPEETKKNRGGIEPLQLLFPTIDYVASFEAVEPAPAYQILESQQDVLARISKPVLWIGYNEAVSEWEPIIDDGRSEYRRIQVGLQMVDRRGPLSHNELSIFHVAMQDLADELMSIAEMPPRQNALDTAVNLDQFCASVDIQIGINVIRNEHAFPGAKIQALAEAAGMVIDSDGSFVRCDDDGNVLYALVNQEASNFSLDTIKSMSTNGLTFLLDVPQVAHGERVFNQMVELAGHFADALSGLLVDDNRRPLSEGKLEPIRRQIVQYQAQMAGRNLSAGSALARRLFA